MLLHQLFLIFVIFLLLDECRNIKRFNIRADLVPLIAFGVIIILLLIRLTILKD